MDAARYHRRRLKEPAVSLKNHAAAASAGAVAAKCGAAPGTRGHAVALPHAVRRSAGTRGFLPEAERGVGGHESRHCCLVGGHATAPARSTVVLAGRGRVRGCGRIRSRGVLPKPRSPRDPPAVVALTWWALLGSIPRPAELDRRKVGHQPSGSRARRRTDPRPLLHRWRAPARTDAEAPRPARGLRGPLPGAHLRDPRRGCATGSGRPPQAVARYASAQRFRRSPE